jgi:hypothetical protein
MLKPKSHSFAVEAFDEEYILGVHRDNPAFGGAKSAFSREAQHCVLGAGIVPAIIIAVEFRDPKTVTVLHDRFWASATHRGAEQHEILNLLRLPLSLQ